MTFTNMILVGVALFAIVGAIGAFTVAFRRTRTEEAPDPTAGVSQETRKSDRSMAGVRVEPLPQPEPEPEVEVEVAETAEAEPEAEPELVPAGAAVQVIERQRVVEVTPEESGVTRRQFFNRALSGTFFAFLGLVGINSLAFFWPKLSGGFGTDVDAGSLSDIQNQTVAPDGSIVPVFVPEARAYIVPAPTVPESMEGDNVEAAGLMALFQRCVHLGCRVPWCATSQGFECPCHGSKYSSIGEYFAGPAPRNLDRFVVAVENDRFIIRTGTIIQTPRAQLLSISYPRGPSCIG
jgi:cytochrome b6-f complex iron-sulfur subunit